MLRSDLFTVFLNWVMLNSTTKLTIGGTKYITDIFVHTFHLFISFCAAYGSCSIVLIWFPHNVLLHAFRRMLIFLNKLFLITIYFVYTSIFLLKTYFIVICNNILLQKYLFENILYGLSLQLMFQLKWSMV